MHPSEFVKENSLIEVQFIDGDDYKWFKGIVKKININAEDEIGSYVNCNILYEDDELAEDAFLYDCNFEESNGDGWRFQDDNSKILKMVYENTVSLNNIKDMLESSDSESDTTESSAYQSDNLYENKLNAFDYINSVVVAVTGISISMMAMAIAVKVLSF